MKTNEESNSTQQTENKDIITGNYLQPQSGREDQTVLIGPEEEEDEEDDDDYFPSEEDLEDDYDLDKDTDESELDDDEDEFNL